MPVYFAEILFWEGGEDRREFSLRGDAVAWARKHAGKRDHVVIGTVNSKGDLYQKLCGNLVPA